MFHKKINQDDLKPIKMALNNFLLIIFLLAGIGLLSYTLANPFDFTIISEETFHLQVTRALLIVTGLLVVLLYGINLYYGIYFVKYQEKENALIAFTSIFIIPAIYSFVLNILKFNKADWKPLFDNWFGSDETFVNNDKNQKKIKNVSLVFSIIMIPTLFLSVFMIDYSNIVIDALTSEPVLKGIFFASWSKFTIQSNLLLLIFTFFFYVKMDSKIFRNNTLLIWIMAYISITFTAYNLILLPAEFKSSSNPFTPYQWIETILQHMLYPVLFVIYGFYIMSAKFYKNASCFVQTTANGMIYPVIYLTFSTISPWLTSYSTYGAFTSTNPLVNDGSSFSLVYLIGFTSLFSVFIALYWFINKKILKVKK